MGLIGVSLLVGAVVLFCLRPPTWFLSFWNDQHRSRLDPPSRKGLIEQSKDEAKDQGSEPVQEVAKTTQNGIKQPVSSQAPSSKDLEKNAENDRRAMPPPPPPSTSAPIIIQDDGSAEQTTPKASPAQPTVSVPSLSLNEKEEDDNVDLSYRAVAPGTSTLPMAPPPRPAPGLMAPPSRPAPRLPTLNPIASRSWGPNPRNLPIPNRGGAGSSLMPPPSLLAKPQKPSRQVVLTPGHSPLDWARLSSNPGTNLRGVPADSPYLKVTPSMLKKMTGRKGKDAWMGLGGRVYNITPYVPFHPGGEPELLRGAGRDGTKLFGEIHPWVNYEGMLSACLIGIMVSEEEGAKDGQMEEMD